MKRIVAFGPGPQFKGGIANYNTSLARALDRMDDVEVHIVSWIQQYPAIVPRDFLDRKSRGDKLGGTGIRVHYLLDYNRPGTWKKTVRFIRDLDPDRVIIQWAIAIQGIPLRYVARKLMQANVNLFFDLHFVIQKENSRIDRWLTRRCIRYSDGYITHSMKTFGELNSFFPEKNLRLIFPGDTRPETGTPVMKLYHPVYDMFRKDESFDVEGFRSAMGLKTHVFLFFGFIRKYKGLHNAIEAFRLVARKRDDVSLLIVGELFWDTLDEKKFSTRLKRILFGLAKKLFLRAKDDEREYRPLDLIDKYGLQDRVVTITEFVPDEEVYKYFQASDAILLFYLKATPSGVESMAYNFGLPILATDVDHFPETIKPGFNGYLARPDDPESMAEMMIKSIESPIPPENVYATSEEMSWDRYASAVLKV
ncbi:MAG TPA: glycosyltransferase [Bacteroides sp.]|nr:glycosyltransferase [Bacteroides sp.]